MRAIKQPLHWVRVIPRPSWARRRRPTTTSQREGHRYEAAFAAALGDMLETEPIWGRWWEFKDALGLGYAQCDLLIETEPTIILECKLKARLSAFTQLERFYAPLISALTGTTPRCVLVAKNLSPEVADKPIVTTWSAVEAAWPATPILHWRRGPIPA